MRAIDADALYERICDLEAQALSYVGKIGNDEAMRDKWRIWSAILAERTAFKHDVFDAPTIELKHEWIPCSETVDIPDHEVLACDKYGEEIFGYLEYADEQWICASEACVMYDPIAWMEKPEPYKEEG